MIDENEDTIFVTKLELFSIGIINLPETIQSVEITYVEIMDTYVKTIISEQEHVKRNYLAINCTHSCGEKHYKFNKASKSCVNISKKLFVGNVKLCNINRTFHHCSYRVLNIYKVSNLIMSIHNTQVCNAIYKV
jgi:hypothetical protein